MMRFVVRSMVVLMMLLGGGALGQEEMGFVIIAHPALDVSSLDKSEISDLFLKRTVSWPDGTGVQPVDLPGDSAVRSSFSETIHGRTVSAVKSFWQRQIFSGRSVPPLERPTDEEILTFVRSNPGAIGYVSTASPTEGVKTVAVREN